MVQRVTYKIGDEELILEIANAVGICSVSYFNRIFKKYHNCSPSFYRQAQYIRENAQEER